MKAVLSSPVWVFALATQFMAGGTCAEDNLMTMDEKALLKLEREWIDAEIRHDAVALNAILDDRFVATFGGGKPLNKDSFIKQMTAGDADLTVAQALSDETIIVVGDTAVIVETDTVHRTKDGQPSSMAYRFTVTYIRRGDHWVALAEHGAVAKP